MANRFGTLSGITWVGIWKTLHPRLFLHALGGMSVHSGVLQASLELGSPVQN